MSNFDYARTGGFDRKTEKSKPVPQSRPLRGREKEMAPNEGGGYGFVLDDFARLNRFLILGTEGGSYHVSEKELTKQNLNSVEAALIRDPIRVIDMAVDVLRNGRAFKTDPALFVLARAISYKADLVLTKINVSEHNKAVQIRKYALDQAISVVRQSTQLFHLMKFVQEMRGWGSGLRKAFARWYTEMPEEKLATQVVKYKSRDGVSHRDMLRLAHPKWPSPDRATPEQRTRALILQYVAHPDESILSSPSYRKVLLDAPSGALGQIAAAEELLSLKDTSRESLNRAVHLIGDHRLTHEMVAPELKNSPEIWEALAQHMPMTATLRNLGKMTQVGLISPLSKTEKLIVDRLTSASDIVHSRTHPMQFLIALKQYGMGRGLKGSLVWNPSQNVNAALDQAFQLSFGNVEATGKRLAVAVDVSGSMTMPGYGTVLGLDGWISAELAGAMAFIHMKTEPNSMFLCFDTTARVTDRVHRMSSVQECIQFFRQRGGGTDTSSPLAYLQQNRIDVDAIVTYTDNVTWAGNHHVVGRYKELVQKLAHPVRLINCATSAHSTTDVDPTNSDMFEMAGFDASGPRIVSEFIRGGF